MNGFPDVKVRARITDYGDVLADRVALWIKRMTKAQLQVARLEWVDADPHVRMPPGLVLEMEHAQRLMDDLWNCGLRPAGGRGSVGQLEATRYHLEDMRTLVNEMIIGGER